MCPLLGFCKAQVKFCPYASALRSKDIGTNVIIIIIIIVIVISHYQNYLEQRTNEDIRRGHEI